MADTIEEYQAALAENPADWEARSTIAQAQYEAEDYDAAAETILGAPELPADEDSIVFAGTIIGAVDVDQAHAVLDSFLATEHSAAVHTLKAELYEAAGDEASAAVHNEAAAGDGGVAVVVPEPEVEAVAAPRKLAPPGQGVAVATPAIAAPIGLSAAPAPSLEAIPHEEQEGDLLVDVGDGERQLIVGEGEAVHAADKEKDSKEKVLAIAAAIAVHLVIGLILYQVISAGPRPNPPQISVSSLANTDESSMEDVTVTKMQQRTASAVASAQPVISSTAFSNIAMPEVTEFSTELAMPAVGSDTGFGMSMSGFGDVSNMGAIPASMRSRCSMSQRMERLRKSGGQDRAEKAVRSALEWLTKTQNADGSFGAKYKTAMTGLTLLAYLGHCETPESPKFGESVVKAALYLMESGKKNDGMMIAEKGGNSPAYEHGIATYALAELFTMTKESGKEIPRLESVLKKSVAIIVKGQTDMGGWAYGYRLNGREDMSVVGWQVQALKAAYNTGRDFRGVEDALDNAMVYEEKIQDAEGAFKYGPEDARGKQSLTGAALLGMQVWGHMDSAAYKKGMDYLTKKVSKNPPLGNNFYQPYYNTQAFFLHEGQPWEDYNKNFQSKLLDAQNADGSWTGPNVGGHGGEDSHTMNTAWGCLMLEVYYRYLPTTEKVKDLKAR